MRKKYWEDFKKRQICNRSIEVVTEWETGLPRSGLVH
jgi:hypothetical protein